MGFTRCIQRGIKSKPILTKSNFPKQRPNRVQHRYLNTHIPKPETDATSLKTLFKVVVGLGVVFAGLSLSHYLIFPKLYLYSSEIRTNLRYGLFYKNHRLDSKLALKYLLAAQHQCELDPTIDKSSWLYLGILYEIASVYLALDQVEKSTLYLSQIVQAKPISNQPNWLETNKGDVGKLLEVYLQLDENFSNLELWDQRMGLWKELETKIVPLLQVKNRLSVDQRVNFWERMAQFLLDCKRYTKAIQIYKLILQLDMGMDKHKRLVLNNNLAVSLSNTNKFHQATQLLQNSIHQVETGDQEHKYLLTVLYTNLLENFQASQDQPNINRTVKIIIKKKLDLQLDSNQLKKFERMVKD